MSTCLRLMNLMGCSEKIIYTIKVKLIVNNINIILF